MTDTRKVGGAWFAYTKNGVRGPFATEHGAAQVGRNLSKPTLPTQAAQSPAILEEIERLSGDVGRTQKENENG